MSVPIISIESIALAVGSGLIGALITAYLNYFVRLKVSRQSQMESERRLAFVHLVKVSDFVAFNVFLTSILKLFEKQFTEHLADLKSEAGDYQLAHRISAEMAKLIRELSEEKISDIKLIGFVAGALEEISESFKDFKIPPEQLAKLPAKAVLAYAQFTRHGGYVRQGIKLWINFVRNGDRQFLTAEVLHSQWLTLQQFFEFASQLRASLVVFGKINQDEASALLRKQVDQLDNNFRVSMEHQQKAKAAFEAVLRSASREGKSGDDPPKH